MTFLKKLGQVLLTVASTAIGVGPIITPLLGNGRDKATGVINTVTNDLTSIGQVIIQIEAALHGHDGPAKLEAAIALVGPIIKTSQLVSGKKIADPALMEKGINEITQGVVDVLNSLHADSVQTEVKV